MIYAREISSNGCFATIIELENGDSALRLKSPETGTISPAGAEASCGIVEREKKRTPNVDAICALNLVVLIVWPKGFRGQNIWTSIRVSTYPTLQTDAGLCPAVVARSGRVG
jgi:hypothetical protein